MTSFDSDDLVRRYTERTIGEAPAITMEQIAGAAIPAGVRAYLRAHVRDRLRDDLGRAGSFARVRSTSAPAARLEQLFIEEAARHYTFPRDEFLSDLENAVRFTENYVCRPRWTLTSFLFHEKDPVPAAELFAKLEYVTEYIYLPQLLRRTIAQREITGVSRSYCAELIRRIDSAVVREHAPRELAALAAPLFALVDDDADGEPPAVPLRPILLFFEDKELLGLRDYIEGICRFRHKEALTAQELTTMCEDFLSGGSEVPPKNEVLESPEVPPAEVIVVPAPPAPEGEPPPVTDPEIPEAGPSIADVSAPDPAPPADGPNPDAAAGDSPMPAADPEIADPGPAAGRDGLEDEPAAVDAAIPAPEEVIRQEITGDQPGTGVETPVPPLPPPARPEDDAPLHTGRGGQIALPLEFPPAPADLARVIRPDQRKRFITVLCDRDADFYDLVIARLNDMTSWQEASGYLRELFDINAVDPFCNEAIAFTDIVQQRFLPGTGHTA